LHTPEIDALKNYLSLSKKSEKIAFINTNDKVIWTKMDKNKDGTYGKPAVKAYIKELQLSFDFPEDSYEANIIRISKLLAEEKDIKKQIKDNSESLHNKTKEAIENLSNQQALKLLEEKWVFPLSESIGKLPEEVINDFVTKIGKLSKKYAITSSEIELEIKETASNLSGLIDELVGNSFDMKGLKEFQKLLKGEQYE